MKATLGDARPVVAKVLGMCSTDERIPGYLNEAVQRLLPMGKWVGTYQHYRFCATSGCITLPRQLETLEVAALCQWPATIRNEWHQYIGDGFGLQSECVSDIQDKGEGWVAFNDVIGANKKLRVYSDTAEAADSKILLQFWNQNALPVRTLDGANWINGEKVVISTTPTNTVNFCMPNGFVGVQKPITNGTVFIYEYDTVTLAQRLLAMYEPDETRPNYRRYVIPFAAQSGSCSSQVVDVIAKRRFIPVINDNDWLLIGNLGALKLACMAILKEENNLAHEASIYWDGGAMRVGGVTVNIRGARQILDDELQQFLGDGSRDVIQIVDEFANAAVCNLI